MPWPPLPENENPKMLAQRISAFQNVSCPPLSRLRMATTLFGSAVAARLKQSVRATWRYIRDKQVCPKCQGHKRVLQHVIHDEFAVLDCRLCKGKGEVTWREVESHKWGRALREGRLHAGLPIDFIAERARVPVEQLHSIEEGLVPLHKWPTTVILIADLQLDREAAGHVSTT